MADYNQPDYVTKRPRYFNNQFLSEQDFIDEQRFHIDRQRRHDRLLHVAGIAVGLEVTANATAVTVAPGTAVDELGRHLLMDTLQTLTLTSEHQGNRVVYLRYQEVPSDEVEGDKVRGHSRFNESALVFHEAPGGAATDGRLVLAELTVAADGQVSAINTNNRRYSGLRLAGPAGKALTLRSSNDGTRAVLDTSLSVSAALAVGTVNPATAQLEVKAGANLPPLRITAADGKDLLVVGNDSSLALGAGDRVGKLTLNAKKAEIELGAGIAGKEPSAGKIGYQLLSDGLDIIGAGSTDTDRKVTVYAEGGTTFRGPSYFQGAGQFSAPLRLPNQPLYLRQGDDNHGLSWYGDKKLFSDVGLDGPFLFGWSGGGLGTFEAPQTASGGRATPGYQRIALSWTKDNRVGIGVVKAPAAQLEIQAAANTDALRVTDPSGRELLKVNADATTVTRPIYLSNQSIYLRSTGDTNHGLAYLGGNAKFQNLAPDGPVLFGCGGGGLGTRFVDGANKNERVALSWGNDGAVKLDSNNKGDVFASGFPERVRMLRGTVRGNGDVQGLDTPSGPGFKVKKIDSGLYDVTFEQEFTNLPTVVATQQFTGSNERGGDTRDNAVLVLNERGRFRVKTGDGDGKAADRMFHFFVIGW